MAARWFLLYANGVRLGRVKATEAELRRCYRCSIEGELVTIFAIKGKGKGGTPDGR